MTDTFGAGLDIAATWLVTYLLHSTVLILGAYAGSRFLTARPRTRDVLWRVALLGGLATATVALAVPTPVRLPWRSVDGPAERISIRAATLPAAAHGDPLPMLDGTEIALHRVFEAGPRVERHVTLAEPEAALDARMLAWRTRERTVEVRGVARGADAACSEALRSGTPTSRGWRARIDRACGLGRTPGWYAWLVVLWAVGSVIALVPVARARLALGALCRGFEGGGRRAVRALRSLGDAPPVRLVSSSLLHAPCVLPGRTIGVPPRCERELSDTELRAALAHELAHVVRRDVAWSALLRGVVAVFWLQPLNRVALRGAMAATEEACDDWALARTGERLGLATSISRVASWAAGLPDEAIRAPVAIAGRDGAVSARVRRILDGDGPTEPRWLRFGAALAIALPILVLPRVPTPVQRHAEVVIEERSFEEDGVGLHAEGDSAREFTVFVARLRTD